MDSITNCSHSEGSEDELVVEPLIDKACSLSNAGVVVSMALPGNRERHSIIDCHLTGEIVLNQAMRDAIDEDMGALDPSALGTLLLVARFLLRSIWGMLAIVLMRVAVISSALGFAGWTGMKLFGESGAALFVLMAVTVAHSVHIIETMAMGLRQGLGRKQAAVHSLRENVWPVFLASFTTAAVNGISREMRRHGSMPSDEYGV